MDDLSFMRLSHNEDESKSELSNDGLDNFFG